MTAPALPPQTGDAAFAHACLTPAAPPPQGLRAAGGDPVARRFAIHRTTVRVTLIDALAVAFPVVRALVGDAYFVAAAGAFVAHSPPRSPVLAHYGQEFPEHLAQLPGTAPLPYLPDVARLERLMIEAYHAADARAACRADLAAETLAAAATLPLARHPATRWLRSPWPVVTLWRMNSGHLPLRPLDQWTAEAALVTRPELDVELSLLPPHGERLLEELATPRTLGALAERLAAPADLATVLPPLLGRGALTWPTTSQPRPGDAS